MLFLFQEQEHLKPQIVHALASAELYCLAMSNIYSDPNYHNLNHSGIIQALIRKGVTITEPSDAQLTETVLIQTNPIKMVSKLEAVNLGGGNLPVWTSACRRQNG